MNTVFVYGTLLKGECNHNYYLGGIPCLGQATLRNFDLYDLGRYPGIITGDGTVLGEVYEVSDDKLSELDVLEGLEYGLYIRQQAEVTMDNGETLEAAVYVYNNSVDGCEKIPLECQPYTAEWKCKRI